MSQTSSTLGAKMVYLVRHGEAVASVNDPARPLTEVGRQSVRRIAEWAATAGIRVSQIRHSGKLRAEQTAEILAEQLQLPGGVVACEGLRPNDDIDFIQQAIHANDGPLMFVGHLPHLGRLVGQLVAGDAERSVAEFGTAALVALVRREGNWTVLCSIQPQYLK